MKYKYGNFTPNQVTNYKKLLHNKIHWLLIYKDPETEQNFKNVNIPKYVASIQYELNGLNEILEKQPRLISLICLIEQALVELKKEDFNFEVYRRLLLDAHSLIDKFPDLDLEV